jgi:hypothetical protein
MKYKESRNSPAGHHHCGSSLDKLLLLTASPKAPGIAIIAIGLAVIAIVATNLIKELIKPEEPDYREIRPMLMPGCSSGFFDNA